MATQSIKNRLVKLIKLLGDTKYHDEIAIGKQLGISPDKVCQLTSKLEQYKTPLVYSKDKGYKLKSPLILLDTTVLQKKIHLHDIEIQVLASTTSTNDVVKQKPQDPRKVSVCFAETQTAGRGRSQKSWHSPFAQNLYLSIYYPVEQAINTLNGISLVVGLAICQAIESSTALEKQSLNIKWPNDIFIGSHKLGGILIETMRVKKDHCELIIGVGINVNMQQAPHTMINQPWTSITNITKQYIDRNLLGAEIMNVLVDYLQRFSKLGLEAFQSEWRSRDYLLHQTVSIRSGDNTVHGKCLGINNQGLLIVETNSGEILTFSAGDASVSNNNQNT